MSDTVLCANGHRLYTLEKPLAYGDPVYAALFTPIGAQPPLRDQVVPAPCRVCGDGMWFAHLVEGVCDGMWEGA